MATETCANCGKSIGSLETPRIHDQHIVCAACWQTLQPSVLQYAIPVAQPPRVQTTQQTGKIWKLQILIASIMCVVGIVSIAVSSAEKSPQNSAALTLGVLCLVFGIAWIIFAKIGAWWFHG